MVANSLTWVLAVDNSIVYIDVLLVIFSCCVNIFSYSVHRMKIVMLFLIFYIFSFFLFSISIANNDVLIQYFRSFILFGVGAYLIVNVNVSIISVYKILIILSLLVFPFSLKLVGIVNYGDWMSFSYFTLRYYLVALLILFFSTLNWIWKCLSVVVLILYSVLYLSFASRGLLIAIPSFIFICYFIKKSLKVSKYIFFRYIFFLGGSIFILCLFSKSILLFINELLGNAGIYFMPLEKTLRFFDSDLSNGRSVLYIYGYDMILKSPIWGNGIGAFDIIYGEYPHNIFLQVLCEGGIALLIPFVYVFIKTFRIIFSLKYSAENRFFISLLFFAGGFELLLSNTLWRSQIFWLYVWFVFSIQRNTTYLKK